MNFQLPPQNSLLGGRGGVARVFFKWPANCLARVHPGSLSQCLLSSVSLVACAVLHAFLNFLWKGGCYLVVFFCAACEAKGSSPPPLLSFKKPAFSGRVLRISAEYHVEGVLWIFAEIRQGVCIWGGSF